MVIWHLKQIGKVKKLDKWVPHELTTNKKMPFWSVVFSYSTHTKKTNHFFVGLWCVTKSGSYMTTGVDQLSGCTEKLQILPKATLAPKKHHGHCLMVCCCSDSLLLSESQWNHYRSTLSRSMKFTVNCKSCSQHWSRESIQFFSMTTPNYMLHN